MAEEKKQETKDKKEPTGEKKSSSGLLTWIIMTVIVVVCAGSGLVLGKLFAKPQAPTAEANDQNSAPEKKKTDAKAENKEAGNPSDRYYNLDPVVANLNEPGATRYVRVTLTIELNDKANIKTAIQTIEEKKPVITNWLTIYLTSLTLDDIKGDKNLKRIQNQILDSFNEKLISGSDSKPMIESILFKEFAIQ